jgi:tetratricopeptide (TPR) repeat protein
MHGRGCFGRCFIAMLLLGIWLPMTATAGEVPNPQAALKMARAGAAELALETIDRSEAALTSHPAAWARWERARIEIEQSRGHSRDVVERVHALPSFAPRRLRAWANVQAAEAELDLGDGAAARAELKARMRLPADARTKRKVGWLTIRSYMIDGEFSNALAAIGTQRAHVPASVSEKLDRVAARVALLRDKPERAWRLLANATADRARVLKWLSGLRSAKLEPADVYRASRAFAKAHHTPAARRAAWVVAAEAALDEGDAAARVESLERAITLANGGGDSAPFDLDAETIWHGLLGLGRTVAHEHDLNADDGPAYLKLAAGKSVPSIVSQGLVAVVAREGSGDARQTAQKRLALDISRQPRGHELLKRLYPDCGCFPRMTDVPRTVRYRLAQNAIDDGDMTAAASVLATLEQPPPGKDAAQWRLTRARAFILGGKPDAGVTDIDALLAGGHTFSFDALRPALFALQAASRDKDAIRIFHALLQRDPPTKIHQKLLFWLADSYAALGQHAGAARLYLRSATLENGAAMNRWARTARYNAAGALAKAGLIDDARHVYKRLLNAAGDPARRAAIRKQIKALPTSGTKAR